MSAWWMFCESPLNRQRRTAVKTQLHDSKASQKRLGFRHDALTFSRVKISNEIVPFMIFSCDSTAILGILQRREHAEGTNVTWCGRAFVIFVTRILDSSSVYKTDLLPTYLVCNCTSNNQYLLYYLKCTGKPFYTQKIRKKIMISNRVQSF